jgi:hypothetical protein
MMDWLFRVAPFLDGGKRGRPLEEKADVNRVEPAASPVIDVKTASLDGPACPACGAAMFQRFNRQTSLMFWGCTDYPRCKGTRAV